MQLFLLYSAPDHWVWEYGYSCCIRVGPCLAISHCSLASDSDGNSCLCNYLVLVPLQPGLPGGSTGGNSYRGSSVPLPGLSGINCLRGSATTMAVQRARIKACSH